MEMNESELFLVAQKGLAELKSAVFGYLKLYPDRGLTNVEIGRSLGIYGGHVGHEGHVSRLALELLKADGLVEQLGDKTWKLVDHRRIQVK
jgi:hypothetical protein